MRVPAESPITSTGPVTGYELPVDDAKGFVRAGAVLVDPADPARAVYKVAMLAQGVMGRAK